MKPSNPTGGTEEDAIDLIIDAVINFKEASVDFAAEAELFGDNDAVLSTANVKLEQYKREAKAAITALLAEARKDLLEGLITAGYQHKGRDMELQNTMEMLLMDEKVKLAALGGKSDE